MKRTAAFAFNRTLLGTGMVLACALSANAAAEEQPERAKLEEEITALNKEIAAYEKVGRDLQALSLEELISRRKNEADALMFLRIERAILEKIGYDASREKLRQAMGDPYSAKSDEDTYFEIGGAWELKYDKGRRVGLTQSSWEAESIPANKKKAKRKEEECVTQTNLSEADVQTAKAANTNYWSKKNERRQKGEQYTRKLPFAELTALRTNGSELADADTVLTVLLEQVPKGSTKEQVRTWAGEPARSADDYDRYWVGSNFYYVYYQEDRVKSTEFALNFFEHPW